jgi:hypothetical protein
MAYFGLINIWYKPNQYKHENYPDLSVLGQAQSRDSTVGPGLATFPRLPLPPYWSYQHTEIWSGKDLHVP